ncbi:MAG: NAD-dependent epimerase/dehydratase family protein [Candidatus Nealsonbacteria bacterium]
MRNSLKAFKITSLIIFMVKKVLITGGAGFIGTSLAKNLISKGLKVRLFDLIFTDRSFFQEQLGGSLEIEKVQGSILDRNALSNAMKGCNYVAHLAALVGVRRTELERIDCLDINILGTVNVLESCLKERIEKVLFSSSSEVYGETDGIPIKEDSSKNPVSIYAITKLAGEEYIRACAGRYGFKYSIVRLFNIYGPGQVADFVVPRFIKRVLNNEPPIVYGDGSQVRTFCFVEDVAEGISQALLNPNSDNQIFNIGNDKEPITMKDLAEKIIKVAKKDLKPKFIPLTESDRTPSREINKRIPSTDRARSLLNYNPSVSLEDGIKKVIESNHIIDSLFED